MIFSQKLLFSVTQDMKIAENNIDYNERSVNLNQNIQSFNQTKDFK